MSDETDERSTLVHNEQMKLRATLLNTVAAGFVIAGIITPIVTAHRERIATQPDSLLLMAVWLLLAACLHFAASQTPERLR